MKSRKFNKNIDGQQLENSTSSNPQNSNLAKLELKKTLKTCITGAKTQNICAKVNTCSNSKV